MKKMNKYLEYFKIGFKKSIEYKSYILSILITPALSGIILYFAWNYIYQTKSNGIENFQIGGFTFEEMMVYLLIGVLLGTVRNINISGKISEIIKTGDITIYLCRPISFVKSVFFENFGSLIIKFFVFIFLLIIMTITFNFPYPDLITMIIFIFYGILMIYFTIILSIIIGGFSFWIVEIWGIENLVDSLLWILSGRIFPLSLFPSLAISILSFTPFFYLEYTFARLYLGKLELLMALKAISIFFFWNVLLTLLMIFLYKKAYKKLQTFGG